MKKTNFRSMTLTALILVFALMLGLAIGSLMPSRKASAVTYTPSTIFSAGTGGSVSASEEDEDGNSYVQFTFSEGGAVYFRRDLALKWYESVGSEDDGDEGETDDPVTQTKGALKYLSLEFSFDELQFTTFSLTFESAEENISKDSTSTNAVVFKNDGESVKAAVRNSSQKDDEEWEESAEFVTVGVEDGVLFTIDEEECDIGEFAVYVNGEYIGRLTNIGGYYLEYLSSASSTPRIPIAFAADELTEGASEQRIFIKELNGQSFALDENGKVVDNAPPVLVLNEKVYAYILGKKWSLTYSAIDVCDTSVTVSRYYYMMKTVDGEAQIPEDDDYSSLTTSTFFMPSDDSGEEEQYVSIRFQLTDDSGIKDDGDGYVYLVWYAADNAVATIGEGDSAFDYILVTRNEVGPYYYGVTADEETKENIASDEAKEEAAKFQEAVTAAAEGLSAGDGSYFYVPSLRGLIKSDHADYRNLTFTIYYYKQSSAVGSAASSATSLSYNSLKFEIDEIGLYLFCVLATDASSNAMMYYVDHELVEVTSSNIWDIDEIPKFQFSVSYTGATVEDPGEQSLGYRDSTYSVSSFEIVGLSGYETEYSLYYLDEAAMQQDGVSVPFSSYSDLVTNIKDYYSVLENYLVSINEYNSSITEDDDAWDRTDNEYYWYPDSLSFMPVNVGYYIVKLTITEAALPGNVVTAYQVIDVRNPIDSPPDSTYWLQNNVTSVVLFSISAVLAIIIVILFVVKPADKTVDEVDLSKLKKMESRKKGVLGKTEKKEEEDK